MFSRRKFLSLPLVVGAVIIGVASGKAIFGPPLEEYWTKKLQEVAAGKEPQGETAAKEPQGETAAKEPQEASSK